MLLTAGWVFVSLRGVDLGVFATVGITGLAVLGSSFLLAWAAETAEEDVPRAFAIAVLAILAVAPEYAVDALFAWQAGAGGATIEACGQLTAAQIEAGETPLARACHSANLAIANMTGANRILIGIGWAGIALFTVWRSASTNDPSVTSRDGLLADVVELDKGISTEIAFLFAATLWAFFVPLGGGIGGLDTLLLVGLYVSYIVLVLKSDKDTEEPTVGVPKYFQDWSLPWRPLVVILLFLYSGLMIFTAVEPFAHGLEEIGLQIGVPSFFMIQWIAPLASESPELIVVAVLVNKARSTAGFNALISSKLNQWTLLIGTIAVIYSIALGAYGVLPFDARQSAEIWITAGQSFFALAILCNFEISLREALVLFLLFISQVLLEFALIQEYLTLPIGSHDLLLVYTAVYIAAGVALFAVRRESLRELIERATDTFRTAVGRDPVYPDRAD